MGPSRIVSITAFFTARTKAETGVNVRFRSTGFYTIRLRREWNWSKGKSMVNVKRKSVTTTPSGNPKDERPKLDTGRSDFEEL